MRFRYVATDARGVRSQGIIEAGDLRSAAASLRDQKQIPISVEKASDVFNLGALTGKFGRVTGNEITNFTRQLSTMITAGLPLTDALNLLKIQSSPHFSPIIGAILIDVQAGVSVSEAMSKHSDVFSKVYVALVKAGEAAGVLETILARLAENLEKNRDFEGKVKGAMIYPVIILIGMVLVMGLMMIVVVPKLTELYADFDTQLPLATTIVIATSNFLVKFWWLVLVLTALVVAGLRSYIGTENGRRWWDTLRRKIPVMGPLSAQVMLSELARTLALLVGAGVSVVEGLRIVSGSLGNVVVETEVKRIARQVEKGFPVSVCFTESLIFPPIIGQMVAVGEETGKMDEVLAKLAHYFEGESELKIKGLTTAIEPIILVFMGLGVGFLMYAIILPIYSITDKI